MIRTLDDVVQLLELDQCDSLPHLFPDVDHIHLSYIHLPIIVIFYFFHDDENQDVLIDIVPCWKELPHGIMSGQHQSPSDVRGTATPETTSIDIVPRRDHVISSKRLLTMTLTTDTDTSAAEAEPAGVPNFSISEAESGSITEAGGWENLSPPDLTVECETLKHWARRIRSSTDQENQKLDGCTGDRPSVVHINSKNSDVVSCAPVVVCIALPKRRVLKPARLDENRSESQRQSAASAGALRAPTDEFVQELKNPPHTSRRIPDDRDRTDELLDFYFQTAPERAPCEEDAPLSPGDREAEGPFPPNKQDLDKQLNYEDRPHGVSGPDHHALPHSDPPLLTAPEKAYESEISRGLLAVRKNAQLQDRVASLILQAVDLQRKVARMKKKTFADDAEGRQMVKDLTLHRKVGVLFFENMLMFSFFTSGPRFAGNVFICRDICN